MRFRCKACWKEMRGRIGHFQICTLCGSASYFSNRRGEEENEDYFKKVFGGDYSAFRERQRWFHWFEFLDCLVHRKNKKAFQKMIEKGSVIIRNGKRSIEVGFGGGSELLSFLNAGVDICGTDQCVVAVDKFKERHPQYYNRVSCCEASNIDGPVQVVYSSAVFEHLDYPRRFLQSVFSALSGQGHLILRLPVLRAPEETASLAPQKDINFWKPCHRMLYSLQGLKWILASTGFEMVETATLDYYGFKVMSCMLEMGVEDIGYVRNPYFRLKGLESETLYKKILLRSLFWRSLCLDCIVIAQKSPKRGACRDDPAETAPKTKEEANCIEPLTHCGFKE